MRLIDADKFKQQVAAVTARDNLAVEKGNAVCRLIDQQPTACDVDKVVERLESELNLADKAKGYARGIAIALEIVKSGMEGLESDS